MKKILYKFSIILAVIVTMAIGAYGIGGGLFSLYIRILYLDLGWVEINNDNFLDWMMYIFPLSIGLNIIFFNSHLKNITDWQEKRKVLGTWRSKLILALMFITAIQYHLIMVFKGFLNDLMIYGYLVTLPLFIYLVFFCRDITKKEKRNNIYAVIDEFIGGNKK